jgi:osmotically-inducible protein OsmY
MEVHIVMGAETNTNNVSSEKLSAVGRVLKALGEDKRTAKAPIEVREMQGGMYLVSTVNSPEIRKAAVEITQANSGISAVINELDLKAETSS